MRIPFISSKSEPVAQEEPKQQWAVTRAVLGAFSTVGSWFKSSDLESSLGEHKVTVVNASQQVLKVARNAEGVLVDEGAVKPLSQAASTVHSTLSLGELREAINRARATQEVKEMIDSSLTAVLQVGRIAGGLSTIVALVGELQPLKLGGPLLAISGLLALAAPVQLGLRWWDADRCLKLLADDLSDEEVEDLELILCKLEGLLEQDPLYLERTFRLTPEEQEKIVSVAMRVLEDQPGAIEGAEVLLDQLKGRLKKSIRIQQIDLLISIVSISSFGLLMFTTWGTSAQVLAGAAAVIALGKVGYDKWSREDLLPEREIELQPVV